MCVYIYIYTHMNKRVVKYPPSPQSGKKWVKCKVLLPGWSGQTEMCRTFLQMAAAGHQGGSPPRNEGPGSWLQPYYYSAGPRGPRSPHLASGAVGVMVSLVHFSSAHLWLILLPPNGGEPVQAQDDSYKWGSKLEHLCPNPSSFLTSSVTLGKVLNLSVFLPAKWWR